MTGHDRRLGHRGVSYSRTALLPVIETRVDRRRKKLLGVITGDPHAGSIQYALDSKDPAAGRPFRKPFLIPASCEISPFIKGREDLKGLLVTREICVNDASGLVPELQTQLNATYPGKGAFTLTDGIRGSAPAFHHDWLGFLGNDALFVLDLGRRIPIRSLTLGTMSDPRSWIFSPRGVTFEVSTNGRDYEEIRFDKAIPEAGPGPNAFAVSARDLRVEGRFVRVTVQNQGTCPVGHPGAGKPAWLFIDEFQVNAP